MHAGPLRTVAPRPWGPWCGVGVVAAVALMLPLAAGADQAVRTASGNLYGTLDRAPAWVERFPFDPERYTGIGHADKRAYPGDYRDRAQASALAQISREISVRVTSENEATLTENPGGREETFSQHTSTVSGNPLEGYRLEGVYETSGEFWAWYSLDKERYRQSLEEQARAFYDWLEREAAAVDAALEAGRIQEAVDRYGGLRTAYRTEYLG
ncbi:MAG: hypothetical protein JWP91_1352, partial [Fibrobacteres bacterium]|nr:hypothetical protein [Fibrobacterota bacterium]